MPSHSNRIPKNQYQVDADATVTHAPDIELRSEAISMRGTGAESRQGTDSEQDDELGRSPTSVSADLTSDPSATGPELGAINKSPIQSPVTSGLRSTKDDKPGLTSVSPALQPDAKLSLQQDETLVAPRDGIDLQSCDLENLDGDLAERSAGLPSDSDKTVIRERAPDSASARTETARSDSVGSRSHSRPVFKLGWHAAAESLIGMELDHFRIESLVGIGGMGAVFRGEDTRLNREVAIKAIPVAGRDPESMRRFRFEAQSAAKLDHPNIARVYYVGETPDWSYIVFEFVEGVNLREIVMRQGRMSLEQSVYLIRQVSQALQHASERQVVHRDIKPSNIVLTNGGQAKIVDMGLARVVEMDRSTNDLTASGVTLGTFDYISPEQAHDPRDADVRSDIYSLGCTWYYLLTGYPPFPDGTALQKLLLHGTKMPEDPRRFRADLSDSVIAILRKMIAKKPGDRYQQPLDLIDDLQTLAVLEDLSWTRDSDPREVTTPKATSAFRRSLPYVAALFAIGMISSYMYSDGLRDNLLAIPDVLFPEANDATSRSLSTPKSPEVASVLSVPSESNSVVVDSRFSSDQLETNRQLATTLDQAMERINLSSDADRIVLQSPALMSSSNMRPVNRTHGKLTIESPAGVRCRIEIHVSDDFLSDSRAWLDCGSNALTIVGCDLVWRPTNPRQALIACRNASQLKLIDCSISIEPTATVTPNSPQPSVIRCDSSSGVTASSDGAGVASNVQIHLDRTIIAGHEDVLQVNPPIRTECRISNSLLAIHGSVLQLPRVNGTILGNSRVILDMNAVTTWASRSFIFASWVSGDGAPVPVTRLARQCVFSGMESLVYWDVGGNEEWKFWEQSRRGETLPRWLDFRGEDNSYDEEVTKQLLEAKLRNGMAESLPLSAEARLLAAERGVELTIPWQAKPSRENVKSLKFGREKN